MVLSPSNDFRLDFHEYVNWHLVISVIQFKTYWFQLDPSHRGMNAETTRIREMSFNMEIKEATCCFIYFQRSVCGSVSFVDEFALVRDRANPGR